MKIFDCLDFGRCAVCSCGHNVDTLGIYVSEVAVVRYKLCCDCRVHLASPTGAKKREELTLRHRAQAVQFMRGGHESSATDGEQTQ